MSRVQFALNVTDLDASVAFYSKLFGAEPAKRRPGYANFAIADPPLKLVLLQSDGEPGGTLNHLGVEVQTPDEVAAVQARLTTGGLASTEQRENTCCYARQRKVWLEDTPDGERWEVYAVLADSPTFYAQPTTAEHAKDWPACCGPSQSSDLQIDTPDAAPPGAACSTGCC